MSQKLVTCRLLMHQSLTTVNAILRRSVSICQRLRLPEIVLVFDEAIYAKAQMIRWKDEEYKNRLVIRLGDFHTIMSFCSGIAKIFQDAGLQVSFCLFSIHSSIICLSALIHWQRQIDKCIINRKICILSNCYF